MLVVRSSKVLNHLGSDSDEILATLQKREIPTPQSLSVFFDTDGLDASQSAGFFVDEREIERAGFDRKSQKMMNRRDRLMGAVAKNAHSFFVNAGGEWDSVHPARRGVFTAVNHNRLGDLFPYFAAGMSCVDPENQRFDSASFGPLLMSRVNPLIGIQALINNGLSQLCRAFDCKGPNQCFYDPELSGLLAFIESCEQLLWGRIDLGMVASSFSPFDAFQNAMYARRSSRLRFYESAVASVIERHTNFGGSRGIEILSWAQESGIDSKESSQERLIRECCVAGAMRFADVNFIFNPDLGFLPSSGKNLDAFSLESWLRFFGPSEITTFQIFLGLLLTRNHPGDFSTGDCGIYYQASGHGQAAAVLLRLI